MIVMDFCFQNAKNKGINFDYVLWLGIDMSALINVTSKIYLKRLSSSFRDIS